METKTIKQRKYMSQNSFGYYYFVRRIPNTNKIYKFSLKTKNSKIGKKIITRFLKYSEYLFRSSNMIDKTELSNLLDEYQQLSLVEDSITERKRHKHLTIKQKDGGHPKTIKKQRKRLMDLVFDEDQEKIISFGKEVLDRTTPQLKEFYNDLTSQDDIYTFMTKLIKRENQILFKDLERTNKRFLNEEPTTVIYQEPRQEPKKKPTLTKFQIIKSREEFLKSKYTKEKDYNSKYKQMFEIVEKVNDKDYFEDYTEEDFNNIFFNIVELPSMTKSGMKEILNLYPNDFRKIIEVSIERGLHNKQGFDTLKRKVGVCREFFDYCKKKKFIEVNYLKDEDEYSNSVIKQYSIEEKERIPLNKTQLNKMFLESDLYLIKNIYKEQPSVFLSPLISLFTGTRLNEVCGLSKEDIKEEDGIYYFDIRHTEKRRVKGKRSIRKIPIHSFLIDKLKFLDYVKSLPDNSLLFPDLEKRKHPTNGYGSPVSKVFNSVKTQFINEDDLELNKLDFHSLRNTFLTRLHMGEVEESLINGLAGHKQNTMSYQRYIICELSRLKKEIEKLYIDDIKDSLNIVVKKILDLRK